ncbi:DNA polymerase III subunit delta [Streptococcus caprae]|uniref:DNA polymerase III subunit delta n=1 Tax=Streptococcus caprae TaxID=1640501 RepID=A0ABV8CYZ5_9STRE
MIAIEEIEKLSPAKLGLITVVTGDDVGQYSLLKQRFLDQIAYNTADLTYSYFDLSESSFQSAEMDLESLPFFADQKIVILDNLLDLTTQKKSYLDDKELKRLEAYLENPLDSNRLVIFAPGKLDSKRRIVKLLKRDAQIFEASELKEAELRTYFQKQAHQSGLTFDRGVFDELLVKSSFDFSEVQKNLIFLRQYKGQGMIIQDDIVQAIPKTLQDNIFDLTQLVLSKKIDQAQDLVRDLRLQGEDEIKLIAVMLGQFRTYTQVRILAQQGRNEQQIVADLSSYLGRSVNAFQVKYALRDSRLYSLSKLRGAVQALILCDYQIKQGLYAKDYLFDVTLLKIAHL